MLVVVRFSIEAGFRSFFRLPGSMNCYPGSMGGIIPNFYCQ